MGARSRNVPPTTLASHLATSREPASFPAFPQLPAGHDAPLRQWLEAARVYPVSAVEWQCSERWILGPRAVNDSMWFWIESGTGSGYVGPSEEAPRFRTGPGDLVLIPQGAEHHIKQDPGVAMHLFAVHFHAQVFEGINLLDLLGFPAHVKAGKDAPFETASRSMAREFALKAPGWRAAMAAQITLALLYLVRHHGREMHAPGIGEAHGELPRLLPALEYLDRNLASPVLSVGDLAKQVFLSEVQFRKLFRRVTSASPVKFIQRRRIESACRMLRGSEMSVEEIAEACGFNDVPFFSRVFKQWTKTTPARYRAADGV